METSYSVFQGVDQEPLAINRTGPVAEGRHRAGNRVGLVGQTMIREKIPNPTLYSCHSTTSWSSGNHHGLSGLQAFSSTGDDTVAV